jgi:plasmid maintenance system antidote protein VapI
VLQGQQQIDADLDHRLGKVLGTSAGYWLRVQEQP